MKQWRHAVLALTAVIAVAAFIGCEGEEGPQGPPGIATCTETCHTDSYTMDDYILPYQAEYETSQHANGETFARREADCSRCHSTEGFVHFVETDVSAAVTESSPIGCFACHAPHTNQDFTLRVTGAVDLMVGGEFDRQEANLCATCHQSRPPDPAIDDLATEITSSRWGPHHGPQSNMVAGTGAYEFDGHYSSSMHRGIANGCVGCHMAEAAADGVGGGHTFKVAFVYHEETIVNSKGCTCHIWSDDWDDEIATEEVADYKAEFEEGFSDLLADFVTLGWLSSTGSVKGSAIPANEDARGAVFNYKMLEEDRSMGIHNPRFAEDVLEQTQAYVTEQLTLAGK